MIVFPLRIWSPNSVRGVSKWAAAEWRDKHRKQKMKTFLELRQKSEDPEVKAAMRALLEDGLIVCLTRFAPSEGLDSDNLQGAFKWVRDGVAAALGVPNDNDSRYTWTYQQFRSASAAYKVGVTLIPIWFASGATTGS